MLLSKPKTKRYVSRVAICGRACSANMALKRKIAILASLVPVFWFPVLGFAARAIANTEPAHKNATLLKIRFPRIEPANDAIRRLARAKTPCPARAESVSHAVPARFALLLSRREMAMRTFRLADLLGEAGAFFGWIAETSLALIAFKRNNA